jgi:tetratricopeptide (TPR) repeat protein
MSATTRERARDALRMAESDARHSIELAREICREARAEGDFVAGAIAERAWGLAAYHLADGPEALRHLREAIRLGRRAESAQLAGEARMTLAAVLSWNGQPKTALRELDRALAELSGLERARAQAQRAAILHLLGRVDEAMDGYRAALPALRRAEDLLWVQRVLKNRGVAHTQRREFGAAEADLRAAEELCRELDLDLSLGFVQQNLGFLNSRRGDVPNALACLDLAEARFRALRSRIGRILTDRAELLLSVRLLSEARRAADDAVRALEQEGAAVALPEARLLLAQASLLDEDFPYAERHARLAVREFTRHQRVRWAELARLTLVQCRLRDERQRRLVSVSGLERTADLLATTWPEAAVESRLVAAGLAFERGRPTRGRDILMRASLGRRRGVATLRARAWYAEALLRQTSGDPRGACAAARAGLRVLDEHAAGLGATDLRAHAAALRTELVGLGLRTVLAEGRVERVFEWAERGKASHLANPPARPPTDPFLADALAELRSTVLELEELRGAGGRSARLTHRQMVLEREIRDHHRRQPGASVTTLTAPPPIHALADALAGCALLEFVQLDGRLHLLTVVDGRKRLRELGPLAAVAELVEVLPFCLRQVARRNISDRSRAAATALMNAAAAQLDDFLLRPAAEIADRPLVVIPTGQLQSLPWAVLPSCRGRPVTISPSATLWRIAGERRPASGSVLVAAGPGLIGAREEADAIAAIHRTTAVTDDAATVDMVTKALDGAAVAHLATHGRVNQDNPLFSALRFADGPLMVHDLQAVGHAPHTVVLAACDVGRPVVRTGDELLGLGATLLAQGTSQLIAPVVSVLDVETTPLMIAFHRLLAAGQPAAVALACAQQDIAGRHPTGLAEVAPFVCLGAGFTRS